MRTIKMIINPHIGLWNRLWGEKRYRTESCDPLTTGIITILNAAELFEGLQMSSSYTHAILSHCFWKWMEASPWLADQEASRSLLETVYFFLKSKIKTILLRARCFWCFKFISLQCHCWKLLKSSRLHLSVEGHDEKVPLILLVGLKNELSHIRNALEPSPQIPLCNLEKI